MIEETAYHLGAVIGVSIVAWLLAHYVAGFTLHDVAWWVDGRAAP